MDRQGAGVHSQGICVSSVTRQVLSPLAEGASVFRRAGASASAPTPPHPCTHLGLVVLVLGVALVLLRLGLEVVNGPELLLQQLLELHRWGGVGGWLGG